MDDSINNMNNYEFAEIWTGTASTAQQEEFDALMQQLIKCNEDIKLYDKALELKAKYEQITKEIQTLWSTIHSCPCRYRESEGECNACGANYVRIQALNTEREEIYTQISAILNHFNVEVPEYSSIEAYEMSLVYEQMGEFTFPLYDQNDYEDAPYGHGNIKSEGCGITCAAMIITAYTGKQVTPAMLAQEIEWDGNDTTLNRALTAYGIKNANNNFLTEDSSTKYEYVDGGFTDFGQTSMNYYEIKEKINEGYVAVFQMNKGTFTGGSHFILVTGVTEDGNLIVQDPNGNNYTCEGYSQERTQILQNGFENGFTDEDFLTNGQWSGCYLVEPYEQYSQRTQEETE